ncbi:unnamed protein product [Heligmosomoides polygyrus]|uniref:Secreted protein n=1 Tax=Heligmosomoides polygyrus TaxID=6339 RepID=A0A183FNY2_HELPZ|nr:unnamed protein product [Heligmosomoides polygyrus]
MHRFLFLAVLLYQKTYGVNGINGATARDEATLIRGKLDDIPDTSIDNSLKDFRGVRKKTNWTVTSAVSKTALLLPKRDGRALLPALGHFLLSNNLIEKLCQPVSRAPALRLPQVSCRSPGPVALPDFILLRAASVSLTMIF